MIKATLSSDERLKSRKQINNLFSTANQFFSHPLKVYYLIKEPNDLTLGGLNLRVGVSVPKSLYKKAVKRNRIRRVIKESYRIHKAFFLNQNLNINKSIDWFFVYIDKNGNEEKIDQAMDKIFNDLKKKLSS